ncbi:MAG: MFS transporter [Fimbriimonadaceae bacterium]|nr:MFS transporter [Fimbriimonadaceae bacterium]
MSAELPVVPTPYAGRRLRFWEQLALSAFWFGTNFLWGAMLIVVVPHQVPRLAADQTALVMGLILGAGAIVPMLVPLLVGPLSDRCASPYGRRRPYIAVGTLINILGLTAMYAAYGSKSVLVYALAYLLVQFGNNIATAPYSGLIPDLVPDGQRGIASGWMAVMSQVGTLAGGVATGLLLDSNANPTGDSFLAYTAIAAALIGSAALTVFGLRETPLPFKPPRLDVRRYLGSLWIDPRRHPDFAWVWITRALVMLGFYAPLPYLQSYLRDVVGVTNPEAEVPKLMALILIGSSLTGVLGGALSERVGRKPIIYVASTVIGAMALLFPFCRSIEQTLIVGVVFGLGYGAYISVDWALGTDVLPNKADAAKDMAVWHIAMTAPQTIGNPLAGWLLVQFGIGHIVASDGTRLEVYSRTGHSVLFAFAGGCFFLAAILLRNVKGAR